MDLVNAQYIEVGIIGIIILLTILIYAAKMRPSNYRGEQRYFFGMLWSNAAILAAGISIRLLNGHTSLAAELLNHFMSMIFFSLIAFFGYMWLLFTMKKLFPEYRLKKTVRILIALPVLANIAFTVTSPWTGCVYSISEGNYYMRGDYMLCLIAVSCLYWIATTLITLKEIINPTRLRERWVYIITILFPLPTIIGNFVQVKYYGLNIVWLCSALSLMLLFINMQNYQLARDILTGLFNRGQTNKQLEWELNRLPQADYLLLAIMIDVDSFKKINDEYGHLAGDRALTATADVLRKSSRGKNFISRFGGDEFIILGHVKSADEADILLDEINRNVAAQNAASDTYRLSLSIGMMTYGRNDHPTPDELLYAIDMHMYTIKKKKREALGEQ